jgi:hypothetical protein
MVKTSKDSKKKTGTKKRQTSKKQTKKNEVVVQEVVQEDVISEETVTDNNNEDLSFVEEILNEEQTEELDTKTSKEEPTRQTYQSMFGFTWMGYGFSE